MSTKSKDALEGAGKEKGGKARGKNVVRIPIVKKLDSSNLREQYLASVLRHGIFVDDKHVQFLKGVQLLEYLAYHALSQIDPQYLTIRPEWEDGQIVKVRPLDDQTEPEQAQEKPKQEAAPSKKKNVIKVSAEQMKGIIF